MPPFSEKELEERLTTAGKSLVQPPSSLDELLPLLDQIEELLSKVEQSPAKSMQTVLSPLMKSLVMEDLLRHSDVDVKVGVASCISEITRITAPDAPYDDDKMKDVFQLIVSSFENLSDMSSRSFEKRATILETVAKVRSCVIMLDLECDQMIIEMFQHFLKAIRAYHAEIIFTSMETIMTLVLEESEDISPELLAPILAALKTNNETALAIAKKLAEQVIQKSADKLRPYLRQAVKSLDASLDDYSEVVASVCRENTDTAGHSNESILNDQPVAEGKCTSASPAQDPMTQAGQNGSGETNFQDKDSVTTRSPKAVVSNGIDETGPEEIATDANSLKMADSNCQLDVKSMLKPESDDCGAKKPLNFEAKAELAESQQMPFNHEISQKDVHIFPTDVKPVEAAKSLEKVEESTVQHSPSKAPVDESLVPASPAQSGSDPGRCLSETVISEKGKRNFDSDEMASDGSASKKASEGEPISQAKKQRCLGKKQTDDSRKDTTLTEVVASKNDDVCASDSDPHSLDQTEKTGDASNKTEYGSSLRREDGKKSGRSKATSEKCIPRSSAREDHVKDTVTPQKSPLTSTKSEGTQEETPRMSHKRKQTPGKEKASETPECGENLVGSKVKVWWPKDRMFYEGEIASFDSVRKKHKILYIDGDEEVLNLKRERWEFIKDDLVSDGDQDVEHSSPDTSSVMKRKKKGNTNSETLNKRQKVEGSPNSKLKDAAPKSGGKSKDDGKAESESKDNSKANKKSLDKTIKSKDQFQKLGSKGQVESAKASGRSKDDVPKVSSRSEQESQRTSKSKGKTPQSGKTPSSGGTQMTKPSSSKVKETELMKEKTAEFGKSSETAKGKSTDTAKSRESETKGGKKRRR